MSNLAKSAFGLMAVTMLSKILGFVREIVLGYFYGTSAYADIYVVAMNIPLVLFSAIGAALSTTFIPLYHEVLEIGGEKRALEFTNNIMWIIVLISIVLSFIGYIFAEPLVKLFAISFTGEKLALAVKFVRFIIIGTVFISLSSLMTPYLQIKGNFTIPGIIGIPNNIFIIIGIVLSATMKNIYVLALFVLVGMLSQFLIQVPSAIKKGYKFKFVLNFNDKYLRKMIYLVIPVFIAVAVTQVNAMIDRSIASGLGDGIIAALNSANKLNGFIMGIFIVTLGSVIYPTLSKLSTEDNKEQFAISVYRSINCVNLLILPVTVGSMVLAKPIVRLLFERGAFDENSTKLTATALVFYSLGMAAFGIREILGKVFFSLKDTKTPMINGIISMLLNIILNLFLVRVMGYSGLALATSLSSIICIFLLFSSLKKKIKYYGQDKIISTFIKSLIAAILMGVIVYFVYNILIIYLNVSFGKEILSLAISVIIGVILYFVLAIIFKISEVEIILEKYKIKKQ